MLQRLLCLSVGLTLVGSLEFRVANAYEVYFNDFETRPLVTTPVRAGLTGGYLFPTEGYAEIGRPGNQFAGHFLLSDDAHGQYHEQPTAVTLTLLDLPEHQFLDLDFLFARINSWDSHGPNVDYFTVRVDGRIVFTRSFDWLHADAESFRPDPDVLLVRDEQIAHALGNDFPDAAYDMSLQSEFDRIPHTSDSVTIEWYADGDLWQGDTDESWAIDNVRVTTLPEPNSSVYSALAAVFGILSLRRQRKCSRQTVLGKSERLETRIALASHTWNATNLLPAYDTAAIQGLSVRSVVAIDLTGNGLLDVLESNGRFSESLGNGDYLNSRPLNFAPSFVHGVSDLDRDGDLDILVSHYNRGLNWLENLSSPDAELRSHHITDRKPDDVALLDLDADGSLEIATLQGNIDTYIATPEGPIRNSSNEVKLGVDARFARLGDVDADGLIDVIGTHRGNRQAILIQRGTSRTTWEKRTLLGWLVF